MNPISFYRGLSHTQRLVLSFAIVVLALVAMHYFGIHNPYLVGAAALSTANPSLVDAYRERAPNGGLLPLVKTLEQRYPFVKDATWIECNDGTQHKVAVRDRAAGADLPRLQRRRRAVARQRAGRRRRLRDGRDDVEDRRRPGQAERPRVPPAPRRCADARAALRPRVEVLLLVHEDEPEAVPRDLPAPGQLGRHAGGQPGEEDRRGAVRLGPDVDRADRLGPGSRAHGLPAGQRRPASSTTTWACS
jgi:hypothetical protein